MLSEFRRILPDEDCIYFGDTLHMPYGEKSKEQLLKFSKKAFSFFESRGVKAVVMACNTTSATVYDVLKNDYPFKLYPIIQSVTEILANLNIKKIGVFATPATINSHAYKNGINAVNKNMSVIEIPAPEWVKIVENGTAKSDFAQQEIRIRMENMMKHSPEKIVLGCTHFPFLISELEKYAPATMFINPAKSFAEYIKRDLEKLKALHDRQIRGSEEFFVSSEPKKFVQTAQLFYPVKTAELLDFDAVGVLS